MRRRAIISVMSLSHTSIWRGVRRLPADGPRAPLRDFALWALAGLFVLTMIGPVLLPALSVLAWAFSALLYVIAAAAAAVLLRRTYPHETLGVCNVVTLGRLVIVCGLVAPLVGGSGSAWVIFLLASGALALDGVDGWLARRNGRASGFGARFDVEVDAGLALVLSLHAVDRIGPLVLVLGLAHYAFAFAKIAFPWLGGPLPERFSRKAVCVLQIATLIVLQLPIVSAPVAALLVAIASAALAWSFGRDILHLWRERP